MENIRQMTKTHRKAQKPLTRIAVLIGIYFVFAVSLGLGTPGQPLLWQRRGRGHRGAVRTVRLLWIYQREIAVALSWGVTVAITAPALWKNTEGNLRVWCHSPATSCSASSRRWPSSSGS